MKAISYSLFGYDRERHRDCFDFRSYLIGLHLCIRFNRILFPGWQTVLNLDEATYNSPYKPIFDYHAAKGWLTLSLFPNNEPLCRAMLRRISTVFDYDHPEWRYTHVICRDLDSIATYREAQMVAEWVEEDKALHCITDSISHTIPMMGGLVGFRPGYVNDILKLDTNPESAWDKLMSLAPDIDYRRKGSDQDFMNRILYPKLCEHATEHFILGRPHNLPEVNGRHYSVDENLEPFGVSRKYDAGRTCAYHAGAAGYYQPATEKWLYHNDPYKKDYEELENMKEFDQIFYWNTREDLR
jgi:hypothetical protein